MLFHHWRLRSACAKKGIHRARSSHEDEPAVLGVEGAVFTVDSTLNYPSAAHCSRRTTSAATPRLSAAQRSTRAASCPCFSR